MWPKKKKFKGFTLTEVMIVIILIGIIASIATARYSQLVEKSRTAEARHVLGLIRDAELAYYLEWNAYTNVLNRLGFNIPASCVNSFYFNYSLSVSGQSFNATAIRCTAGGKQPQGRTAFVINISETGSFTGTAGFL